MGTDGLTVTLIGQFVWISMNNLEKLKPAKLFHLCVLRQGNFGSLQGSRWPGSLGVKIHIPWLGIWSHAVTDVFISLLHRVLLACNPLNSAHHSVLIIFEVWNLAKRMDDNGKTMVMNVVLKSLIRMTLYWYTNQYCWLTIESTQ